MARFLLSGAFFLNSASGAPGPALCIIGLEFFVGSLCPVFLFCSGVASDLRRSRSRETRHVIFYIFFRRHSLFFALNLCIDIRFASGFLFFFASFSFVAAGLPISTRKIASECPVLITRRITQPGPLQQD